MSLTFITPTQFARQSIDLTAESLIKQLRAGDEWLILVDSHTPELVDRTRQFAFVSRWSGDCDELGASLVVRDVDTGHHCWGNCARNVGNAMAQGTWIGYIDDDDEMTDGALDAIRSVIAREMAGDLSHLSVDGSPNDWFARPILFQFLAPWRQVLWGTRDLTVGNVGGLCIVFPNVAGKIGTWTCDYTGDHAFITSTVALHGGRVAWEPHVIAVTGLR